MGEERGPVRNRLHPSIGGGCERDQSSGVRPAGRTAGSFTRVGASACMQTRAVVVVVYPRGMRHASGTASSWQACIIVQVEAAVSSERALHAGGRKQQAAWKRGLATRQGAAYTCQVQVRREEKHAGACRMVIAERAASCKQSTGRDDGTGESWAGYVLRNRKAQTARLAREHMHGRALLHLHLRLRVPGPGASS